MLPIMIESGEAALPSAVLAAIDPASSADHNSTSSSSSSSSSSSPAATPASAPATTTTAAVAPVNEQVSRARLRRTVLFSGLYVGVASNILKEAPNCAIYIGCYEYFKDVFIDHSALFTAFPVLAYMLAGGLGDLIGSVVRVPAELVNKRLQLGLSGSFRGALHELFGSEAGREAVVHTWRAIIYTCIGCTAT